MFPRHLLIFLFMAWIGGGICPTSVAQEDHPPLLPVLDQLQATKDQAPWSIEFQKEKTNSQSNLGFQVIGLTPKDVETIRKRGTVEEKDQKLLRVYVGDSETPILGQLHLADDRLIFEPRFALLNRTYRVHFNGHFIRSDRWTPLVKNVSGGGRTDGRAIPRLVSVYPTQNELPQNILRMYLQFDGPMPQINAYDHIQFQEGRLPIDPPFLEIAQELWSPDRTRLTLLFDPGRIKRGLKRHEELGPPFEVGKTYTLAVDRKWTGEKQQLYSSSGFSGSAKPAFLFRGQSTFRVTEPDREQPAVSKWSVSPPPARSTAPLTVRFAEPLDFGMLQHAVTIKHSDGEMVDGRVTVSDDATSWTFQPMSAWMTGEYVLQVNPKLEDRCGNSIAQPFEREMDEKGNLKAIPEAETRLSFTIAAKTNRDRPNVVFILADDLGWRDLSCEGSTFYESPNIDRICNEGIRFRYGYAACQVCSPSRAAIMTGKSPARLKITDYIGAPSGKGWKRNTKLLPAFYNRHLPHADTTLAEAFAEAGYKTFFAGKWHLGSKGSHPQDHGFDINVGGHRAGTPPGGYFVPYKNPKMTDGPAGECLPVRLGQETASFIEQHKDQPFLAFLSFYSVHSPIQSSEKLWNKYRIKAQAHPAVDHRFLIDRTLPVRQVQDHPIYAGMIESMDKGVGKVLDTLDRLDLAENTLVIFTSDNGGVSSGDGNSTSNLPLRGGKGRQWEGGIREPFYIRWPVKIVAGSASDTPVVGMDLYPTLLDLCELPARPDQTLDGVSLKPILEGGQIDDRSLIWHYPHYGNQGGEPSSMVRTGNWKMIRYLEDQRIELYDIKDDTGEQNDIAGQHPEVVATMTAMLDSWLGEVSAEQPTPNPNFDAGNYKQWQTLMRDKRLPIMEHTHAKFLNEDFKPTNGWWDRPESSKR